MHGLYLKLVDFTVHSTNSRPNFLLPPSLINSFLLLILLVNLDYVELCLILLLISCLLAILIYAKPDLLLYFMLISLFASLGLN